MAKRYDTETYVHWKNAPRSQRAVVIDLDDTVALFAKDPGLFGCDEFAPHPEVLPEILQYQSNGYDVIVASARPDWCSYRTFKWLKTHGIKPAAVYLKNRTCRMPPEDLKVAMLTDILETWEVEAFYEDNPVTVAAARAIGVPSVHVKGTESYWTDKYKRADW